eukprot:15366217-Ditylum_brightwellii.AAC.1
MERVDIGLGNLVTMNNFHLQRANTGCTNNNAKACYDRIVPTFFLLAYVKVGLPYTTAVFFSHILCNMKYHLTTVFGVSPLFEPSGRWYIVPESELPTNTVRVTDAHGNTTLLTRVPKTQGI